MTSGSERSACPIKRRRGIDILGRGRTCIAQYHIIPSIFAGLAASLMFHSMFAGVITQRQKEIMTTVTRRDISLFPYFRVDKNEPRATWSRVLMSRVIDAQSRCHVVKRQANTHLFLPYTMINERRYRGTSGEIPSINY